LKGPHFVSRHPMCYIPGCQVKVLYIGWLLWYSNRYFMNDVQEENHS
jgi:hypothetical protein